VPVVVMVLAFVMINLGTMPFMVMAHAIFVINLSTVPVVVIVLAFIIINLGRLTVFGIGACHSYDICSLIPCKAQ